MEILDIIEIRIIEENGRFYRKITWQLDNGELREELRELPDYKSLLKE